MNASVVVSASLFVLSTSIVMFASPFRRSLLAAKPAAKRLSTGAISLSGSKSDLVGKTQSSPVLTKTPCHEEGSASCEACADKVNDMLGSVKAYDRHVIISVPSSSVWESDIERQTTQFPYNLIKHFDNIKKANKALAESTSAVESQPMVPKPLKLKLTAMIDDDELSNNDDQQQANVIVYPDNLKFTLTVEQFAGFADMVSRPVPLAEAAELPQFTHTSPAWKKLVLVCVHNARDKRCGQAGPEVISELRRLLGEQQQQEEEDGEVVERGRASVAAQDIAVRGSSHIGGHVYAGTMIVYPEGRWYGRITRGNAAELLQHIKEGSVFSPCERGVTYSKVLQW